MPVIPVSVDAFAACGLGTDDARSRVDLVRRVLLAHDQATGVQPAWCWLVPGRIEVFGKHTDYAGGRSLLAAVPRGFCVAASPRRDDVIRVVDAGHGEARAVSVEEARRPQPGWLNYIATVVRRLALNFPGAPLGTDVTLASDLPRASGLSSSSALVVGVATALIRRGGVADLPAWRETIGDVLDLAAFFGALERGAPFKALDGTAAVGVFGGSEDHTAILTCRPGCLSAYRYQPIEPAGDARLPADWRFVVLSSGVAAAKAGSAKDRYNRASLAAEALVDLWNQRFGGGCRVLAEVLQERSDAAERLRETAAECGAHRRFAADVLCRRLDHFLGEDGRVPVAVRAVRDADAAALGELSSASQGDAERLLENQTPETSTLARLARECGAFAACSFGAGFGGSVWALASAADAEAFAREWVNAYRAQFPERQQVACFTARPGPGLMEVGPAG